MNFESKVVISVPRICGKTSPSLDKTPLIEEKFTEYSEKNGNEDSIKKLGSSFTLELGERKNSAFSLYEASNISPQEESVGNGENADVESQSFGHKLSTDPNKPRKWKKIKRSKREMNRLETKNLNRYFRSKINQMLRDIKQNPSSEEQGRKAEEMLNVLNKSNNIMFSELREIIKNEWLQQKLTTCSGILLKYIHKGKMGTYSKMIMLKYYNKIMKAIRNPDHFSFWK